jgi:hypothetical protein
LASKVMVFDKLAQSNFLGFRGIPSSRLPSDGLLSTVAPGFRAKRRRDGGGAFYRSRSITRRLPLFD